MVLFQMNKMRIFYFIACGLLAMAIITEGIAKHHFATAKSSVARAITRSESDRAVAGMEADSLVKVGERFSLIGNLLALLGITAWIVSTRNPKRMTPVAPTVLLAAYILWYFVLA